MKEAINDAQFADLLLQSLEHEMGGVKVYQSAISCAINKDLRQELEKYLEETRTHVETLKNVCLEFGIDPNTDTPGRRIVRTVGAALVEAINLARDSGNPDAAQIVACECVVHAETKDHLDWELLGRCAEKMTGAKTRALSAAVEQVEDQEDEHLYHSKGWCRELWLQALGLRAVLPPPEEEQHVKTAIAAAQAEQSSLRNR